ncbi:MAG: hypothetical protein ACTFAK_07590 [Candidatus Electronema sp. VV]
MTVGERLFRVGDWVIHRRNNYDLGVFNGEMTLRVFFLDQREQITEFDLAYAITIQKYKCLELYAFII